MWTSAPDIHTDRSILAPLHRHRLLPLLSPSTFTISGLSPPRPVSLRLNFTYPQHLDPRHDITWSLSARPVCDASVLTSFDPLIILMTAQGRRGKTSGGSNNMLQYDGITGIYGSSTGLQVRLTMEPLPPCLNAVVAPVGTVTHVDWTRLPTWLLGDTWQRKRQVCSVRLSPVNILP